MDDTDDIFYASLPVLTRFEGVVDPKSYTPLPPHWVLAVADIVGSTRAIGEGRYKSVNMAGASIISALLNALGKKELPFVFGGDGALVALPGKHTERAAEVLAAVRGWIRAELELDMRVALVPITDIRAAGYDVGIARFAASDAVSYAMFNGGGASFAENQMKSGLYGIPEGPAQPEPEMPDLGGLSCRWSPIPAHNGRIMSIIAKPVSNATMPEFATLVSAIIGVTAEQERDGHPVPAEGPGFVLSYSNIDPEVRTVARPQRARKRLSVAMQMILVVLLHALNLSIGRFNARQYTRDVSANSDFRKFDDGLKMTVDVDEAHRQRIEALLADAEAKGICRYGTHLQDEALMTCFVPTPQAQDHVHFIDGADGGYALASQKMSLKP